jgi:phosphoribosylglycinamide formyltransferase 1
MKNIAIFASGSGSNAERIWEHFQHSDVAQVRKIFTNNPKAGVIARAERLQVPCRVFDREEFYATKNLLSELQEDKIDLIVLAGFLWLFPTYLIQEFPERVINIHPALLPHYGGKGMYGAKVHQAVVAASEKESGITIHYVNEHYDEGAIIFQAKCQLEKDETPETLAQKIHQLEYQHFPIIIEKIIHQISI